MAKELGCTSEIVKSEAHRSINGYNISTINQIQSELEVTLAKYHGISTHHLQGYLNMFVLRKHLNYTSPYHFQVRDTWIDAMPKRTTVTRRNETSYPYPFDIQEAYMDYTNPSLLVGQRGDVAEQLNGVA